MNNRDTSKIIDSNATQVPKARIFSDVIQQLYQSATTGIVANALLGIILVWTLWGSVPQYVTLNWLGTNLAINFIRLLITIYVLKQDPINEQNYHRWATAHVVATGLIASVWGSAALFFYVEERIEFQVFFALIATGMTSAALPMVGIYWPSYLAYLLPVMLPLIAVFLTEEDELHVNMAILVSLYIVTMLVTARRYYARILESTNLRMQFDLLAHMDALTGLANRRAFDEQLNIEWQRMMRTNQPLSLLIIDVDFFKEYNDGYGHQAGDDCLKLIAKTIEEEFRRSGDFVARWGGEEFVALVPSIKSSAAAKLTEQARQAVFDLKIPHPNTDRVQVTISIGLSTIVPKKDIDVSMLYELADNALYTAKEEGRNRVCIKNLK